jgi:hypothetical protein
VVVVPSGVELRHRTKKRPKYGVRSWIDIDLRAMVMVIFHQPTGGARPARRLRLPLHLCLRPATHPCPGDQRPPWEAWKGGTLPFWALRNSILLVSIPFLKVGTHCLGRLLSLNTWKQLQVPALQVRPTSILLRQSCNCSPDGDKPKTPAGNMMWAVTAADPG